MPDESFRIKGITKKSVTFALKIAVLWPIMKRRSFCNKAVIEDMYSAMRCWRNRLKVLYDLKWPDLSARGKLQYARNCPPEIVQTLNTEIYRECKLHAICPWCYMRNVEVVFNKLSAYLPERGRLRKGGINLLEVSGRMKMSRTDAGKYLGGHLTEWMEVPRRILNRIKPLGAYRSIHLDPKAVQGHKCVWRFSYRVLAIVPEGWVVPEWLDNGVRKVRLTQVQSKKQLVNIVGRTCRYPVGLLRGDSEMAMIALNARKGKRLSEYTGCLRSSGESHEEYEETSSQAIT